MSRLVLGPIADGLLAETVDHFDDASVALPERRCIAPGTPGAQAWDCEQLVVALATITPGGGGGAQVVLPMSGSPAGVGLVRLATFAIQLVRCAPMSTEDGTPPDATELAEAAHVSLEDAGQLSQLLVELASLTPGTREWLPIGSVINAGTVTPLGPEGGFYALEAAVTVSAMVTE